MSIFEQLLGRDEGFFDLLESSASQVFRSVQILGDMLRMPYQPSMTNELLQARRENKRIIERINEQLCRIPVAPLDLEDINTLSVALYKISKSVGKFGEKYLLCRERIRDTDFSRQMSILEQTADTATHMVHALRKRPALEPMRDQNIRLRQLEHEADNLMLELSRDLYSGKHDPLKVIIILDLHETLEKSIDRCKDAGNVVFQIVLKCT